jgi:hypothetical protein
LKFTEETFGLAPLAASDARADDLSDCFNFAAAPQAFHRIRTVRSAAELLRQPSSDRPPDDD